MIVTVFPGYNMIVRAWVARQTVIDVFDKVITK